MVVYGVVVMLSIYALDQVGQTPTEIPTFDFILLILATFRLIRLFVYDLIADFIRDSFSKRDKGIKKTLYELLHCPWCVGVWAAWGVGFMYFLTPYAWFPILVVAMAGIGSLIQISMTLILRIIHLTKGG